MAKTDKNQTLPAKQKEYSENPAGQETSPASMTRVMSILRPKLREMINQAQDQQISDAKNKHDP